MEEGYIEEKEWFKCDIDGVTYDCYLEYECSTLLSKPWVSVTVRKYITKKWWFFKWKEEEFECNDFPSLNTDKCRFVNGTFYFKSEPAKMWVKSALNRREDKILRKKSQKEEEKKLKVLKEI